MANTGHVNHINGIDLDVITETVRAISHDPDLGKFRFHIQNKWTEATKNCSTITSFYGAKEEIEHLQKFDIHADEPDILAGDDTAPNPVEHLLNSLAGCLTTSVIAHAAVRGIHIDELEAEISGNIDMRGFLGLDDDIPKGFTDINVTMTVRSDESAENLKRLAEFSPVYNTLLTGANINLKIDSHAMV